MTGIYFYKYPEKRYPYLVLKTHAIPVEITGEKDKRYKVMYKRDHANGDKAGTEHWVLKTKVQLDYTPPPVGDIHLPYKD